MSEENKVVETPDDTAQRLAELEAENKRLKTTLSERNSENAQKKREIEEWRNKYESTLSEAELSAQQRAEAEKERDAKYEALLRKSNISDYKAKYLAMGYSEELAQSSAEAKVDGNDEVLFANQTKFIEANNEKMKAELLKTQPSVSSGSHISAEEAQKLRDEKLLRYAGLI